MSNANKKVGFILAWYNKERVRFSFAKQILLANTWEAICNKNEEYEMASALKKEKNIVLNAYLKNKRRNRSWKQKLWYFWTKTKRKFRK